MGKTHSRSIAISLDALPDHNVRSTRDRVQSWANAWSLSSENVRIEPKGAILFGPGAPGMDGAFCSIVRFGLGFSAAGAAWQLLSAPPSSGRPIEEKSRVARLDQITRRFNELDLGQLSLRIENVQQALLARRCSSRTPARAVRLAEGRIAARFELLVFAELKIWLPGLASLLQGSQGTLSRQIVSLFSPDTLGLVAHPGSAATAGHPHQP